jgi:CheY-like chemotaxis protein
MDMSSIELIKHCVPLNIPIVILSGEENTEPIVRAIQEGASDFLIAKHISRDQLDKVIINSIARIELNQDSLRTQGKNLDESSSNIRITQAIEFPSEFYQAGVSILSYFSTVLHEKYSHLEAKVRIELDGLKVILIVESSSGERDTIEQALNEYGAVIRGEISPEQFYGNNLKALELRQQLRMVQMQLENQRELHQFTEKHYDTRIKSLEEEIVWLRPHVGNILSYAEASPKVLTVHTEGGTYIQGSVNAHKGKFVGRDHNTWDIEEK